MFTKTPKTNGNNHDISGKQHDKTKTSKHNTEQRGLLPGFLSNQENILQLQRTIGNSAVIQLLKFHLQQQPAGPPIQRMESEEDETDMLPDNAISQTVQATAQAAELPVNDEPALENESGVMGSRAETAQMKRGKLVKIPDMLPWFWGENLKASWGEYEVPIHECHTRRVGVNQLVGGYSVIDKEGNYKESKVYGPYDPKEGKKDVGHVERQFMSDAEGPLKTDMADDKKFGDDVLALVEIHQWFTPCSGGKGCTTFLDQKVQELNGEYNEVRVSGRLSAEYLYSQLSETHPKKAKKEFITDIDDDTDYMELDDELSKKKSMIMHNNPGEFG